MSAHPKHPQCDFCGRFILWERAVLRRWLAYDMQHEPYEDEELGGICEKCAAQNTERDAA